MKIKDKYLRQRKVSSITGLPKSTLYYYIKKGTFPKPKRIGARSVGWKEGDIAEWMDSKEDADPKDVQYYNPALGNTYNPKHTATG